MHVLMIVENLPVPFDRRVWSEARTLRSAGHDVSIICPVGPNGLPRDEVIEGVRILRHPLTEARSGAFGYVAEYLQALWWECRLAWRVWRRDRFDVIHICNPPDLLFLVALPYKLRSARVIFDHHDLNPELYAAKFHRRGLFHWLLRGAEWITFRVADHVISTNQSHVAVAQKRGGKSLTEISEVRSAPELSTFLPKEHATTMTVTVGYVGVMAEQDGVDFLLRALAALASSDGEPAFEAILVGDGPARSELERLSKSLGLAGLVSFTGFLQGDELVDVMSAFDIGVCPDPINGYNEYCTMNKVLEYMTLSIPVVQFDLLEGHRSAGDASLYAGSDNDPMELARAIKRLIDEPELRRVLGNRGRQRMETTLAWEHQTHKLLAAYDSVVQ